MTYIIKIIIGILILLCLCANLYADLPNEQAQLVIDSFEQTSSHYISIVGFTSIDKTSYHDSNKRWVFGIGGNSLFSSFAIPYIDTQKGTYFRSFILGLGMPVPYLEEASLRIDAGISGRFVSTSDPITQYFTNLVNTAYGLYGTSLSLDFRYRLSKPIILHLMGRQRSDPFKLNLNTNVTHVNISGWIQGDTRIKLSSKTMAIGFNYIFLQTDFLKNIGLYSGLDLEYTEIKGAYDLIKEESPYEFRRQWTKNTISPRIRIGFNWKIIGGAINYCKDEYSYGISLNHYF